MLIYTCVTPCIFLSNYLLCLNACQWRYGLQMIFRTWLTRGSVLFNYLIDGYCHLLFICYTVITQYYHNITQLDVKRLHLIRYSSLPNRGPPPYLNHNKTLADMPTYNLLNALSVGSFFLWYMHLKSKVRSERNNKKLDSNYIGDITYFIVKGPIEIVTPFSYLDACRISYKCFVLFVGLYKL